MRILLILVFCVTRSVFASVVMPKIEPAIFIANPLTNIDAISNQDAKLKKQIVQSLFDNELIDHVLTKSYDLNADFDSYFERFQKCYWLMDLNQDGALEIVFSGHTTDEMESEMLQIFSPIGKAYSLVFSEKGHFLAYKIHPNTKEILIFHHQYPCCDNGSHNINRLRLVKNSVQMVKRYFVARDSNMKGDFFPQKSEFNKKFFSTKQNQTKLYWSPNIISSDAWPGRSQQNLVAKYPKNTPYQCLAEKGAWKYVIMHGAPIVENNTVINPANFTGTWIYGWIKD